MQIYRLKTLLSDDADFAAFTELYGAAVVDKVSDPFLLVRDDDARLFIATDDGSILLCLARSPSDCSVSYGSSYSECRRSFHGLGGLRQAKDENFVDPRLAIQAVQAFFVAGRMSEHVDFCNGIPEPEITTFPTMIRRPREVDRVTEKKQVSVSSELKADMVEVCEYLDEAANDLDENIDFDDAIQIGSLCGGRVSRKRNIYLFSHYLSNGEIWSFKVPRTILEGIADGSIEKITVEAWVKR
ncbi:MAG: hypothetical protein QM775_34465 [Pirellulales bacterium]